MPPENATCAQYPALGKVFLGQLVKFYAGDVECEKKATAFKQDLCRQSKNAEYSAALEQEVKRSGDPALRALHKRTQIGGVRDELRMICEHSTKAPDDGALDLATESGHQVTASVDADVSVVDQGRLNRVIEKWRDVYSRNNETFGIFGLKVKDAPPRSGASLTEVCGAYKNRKAFRELTGPWPDLMEGG